MKREEMKSYDVLMGLFDHEDLLDEEIIFMRIERYTNFMRTNNMDIALYSLKSVIDDRLYDFFDAYFVSYHPNKNTFCLLYYSENSSLYYELQMDSITFNVLEISIFKESNTLLSDIPA